MRLPLTALLVSLVAVVLSSCSKEQEQRVDEIGPPGPARGPAQADDRAGFGDTVWVEYAGRLTDGTEFDSTAKHGGEPMKFRLGVDPMIKGFTAGVAGMKVGESKTVTIPPEQGYGPAGSPPTIPPNATLIFDIKLVKLQKR